jgi:hypothetical protein
MDNRQAISIIGHGGGGHRPSRAINILVPAHDTDIDEFDESTTNDSQRVRSSQVSACDCV